MVAVDQVPAAVVLIPATSQVQRWSVPSVFAPDPPSAMNNSTGMASHGTNQITSLSMKTAGAEQRVEREQGRDDPTNGAQRSGSSVWCRFRWNTAPAMAWYAASIAMVDRQPPAGIFGSAPDKSSHEHQRKADRLLHRRSPLTSRGTATPPASRAARETPHALTSVVVPEPTPSTWRSAHAPGSTYPAIDMPPARPPTNLNIVPCRLDHGEPPHA